jgi:hypothetical protein
VTTQGTVFGIDVSSSIDVAFLERATAAPTGRPLQLHAVRRDETYSRWPREARSLCEERTASGELLFCVESAPQHGYMLSGPCYGAHMLSEDGRSLLSSVDEELDWQRLVISQVLPFAALLQGLEVFHASAVTIDGQAIGLLGPSGAGKTSVALSLCELGARFLTDDVLAVETRDGELLAHPGTSIAAVRVEEPAASDDGAGRRAKVWYGDMDAARAPAPLAALFFLDRRAEGPEDPNFEAASDALQLLAATFNFVVSTPSRLLGLLDTCALAAELRVERIVAGPGPTPGRLAAAIARRLATAG